MRWNVFACAPGPKNFNVKGPTYVQNPMPRQGICTPLGIRVFDGSVDNPGKTAQERVDNCARACFEKATPKQYGPWSSRGDAVGFGLASNGNGRCYCNHEFDTTCRKQSGDAYVSYSYSGRCYPPAIRNPFPHVGLRAARNSTGLHSTGLYCISTCPPTCSTVAHPPTIHMQVPAD